MATLLTGSPTASARCFSCGADIEHGRTEEHICPGATSLHMPQPNRPMIDRSNASSPTVRSGPLPGKLPKFAPPARIDPFAANEAFLPPPQTAPGFQSTFGSGSPARTGSPASLRFRMPPRSATTPHFRERSRSPELRMPQDSAFPLFPTKKVREERAKKDRQRSKSVSRSQSRDRGTFRPGNGSVANSASRSASPVLPPFTPRPSTAGGSTSRKNSVSSIRSRGEQSPFQSPSEPVPPLPTQHDITGGGSPRLDGQSSLHGEPLAQMTSPLSGPPITPELEDNLSVERTVSERSAHFKQPSVSAAIQPLDAIGSTRKQNHELGLNIPRSQSAGGYRADLRLEGAPPVPEFQSAVLDNHQSDWSADHSVPEVLAIQQPASSYTDVSQDRIESNEDGLGSLPSFRTHDSVGVSSSNRLRTSTSSDGSSYSATHSISSRSSPPTSASSFTLHDNMPKVDHNIDNVIGDAVSDIKPPQNAEPTLPLLSSAPVPAPVTTSAAPIPAPLQQRRRGPAKSFSRPNYPRPQLDLPTSTNIPLPQASPRLGSGNLLPQTMLSSDARPSPLGQDVRSPHTDVKSPIGDLRSQVSMSPMSPADRPFSPMSPRTPQTPGSARGGESSFHPPRRPTTPGFKGNCRGCGEMIVGKSVSSADGRLTGRYHKQCFVCQTCKEPFQTADFYVINNQPYCQRHYHTLNGSLCNNCDRGIEGPYMETDAKKKFHPHCFTCKECHLILRNDYFEVNGVIYCEKHSRKPDLLGPGRRFPERRTTRLMMM